MLHRLTVFQNTADITIIIKFRTKRLFKIFHILKTDRMTPVSNLLIEQSSYLELKIKILSIVNDKFLLLTHFQQYLRYIAKRKSAHM